MQSKKSLTPGSHKNIVANREQMTEETLMQDFQKYYFRVVPVILVAWFLWWAGTVLLVKTATERGQLGDLFGGVNALFSGLALAGMVTAVILQSHESQLQREELKETREVHKETSEANQRAAEALNKQIDMQ